MRLLIVSNRAPVNVRKENGEYRYEESSGGLATGLRAYLEKAGTAGNPFKEIVWVGWPGIWIEEPEERERVNRELKEKYHVHGVFLSEKMMENFYEGFCNKTLWPLFHYFTGYAVYDKEFWEEYASVNRIFCNAVKEVARPGDVIWVHDYQLLLLPAMLRKELADPTIGFFLHIPFPSYEVFRLLPGDWRKEILTGMYGADLIGFHTHDYRTYFLQSSLRILGADDHMGEIFYNNRMIKADTFPMGIDYIKYHNAALGYKHGNQATELYENLPPVKLILSIDRQDYTKGILNRLNGYRHFLQNNPEWRQKATLMLVVVPSRTGVGDYQLLKGQVDQLAGQINGEFGSMEWTPIIYQYRSLDFKELISLYARSDVALVTPLRDGMNLIAKEYIAARTNGSGVLILSEMAGAADELDESILINPNNIEEISNALRLALGMSGEEQQRRIGIMQSRVAAYDVFHWADTFLSELDKTRKKQERLKAKILIGKSRAQVIEAFKQASSRLLFLDYDGTLTPFAARPTDAFPGKNLIEKLKQLSALPNMRIVLLSGRDRATMQQWFGDLPLDLGAEHGLFIKEKGTGWQMLKPVRKGWKRKILGIMRHYEEKLPGAFVEEKEFVIAFHYRRCDPEFASFCVNELMNYLVTYTANMDLQLLSGNKVLEVRNAGVDKGIAALHWLTKTSKSGPGFILSIGDDTTDEDLYKAMPPGAYSIKVGLQPSHAAFNLLSPHDVLGLLDEFLEAEREKTKTAEVHDIWLENGGERERIRSQQA